MYKKAMLYVTTICVITTMSSTLSASSYKIKELNNVGLFDSRASAINNHGDVTGDCRTLSRLGLGPRWNADGSRTELAGSNTNDSAIGYSINDTGQIAGLLTDDLGWHPHVWNSNGTGVTLQGGGWARDINNNGIVVGQVIVDSKARAMVWSLSGDTTDLSLLVSQPESQSIAVSDTGYVVGYSDDPAWSYTSRAFMWSAAGGLYYLPVPQSYYSIVANDVNNAGQVVGRAQDGGGGPSRALRWDLGATTPLVLETPYGCLSAQACSINNQGITAGMASDSGWGINRAVVWDAEGHATELPCLPGDIGSEAYGINDQGQVVGLSFNIGYGMRAVIWEPVPELSGGVTVFCGLLGLLVSRIRQRHNL